MYVAQLLHARRNRRLSGTDWAVLVELQLDLDVSEFRPLMIQGMAFELGLDFSAAARSLRRLIEFGYLVEGARAERQRTYRLRLPPAGGSSATTEAA